MVKEMDSICLWSLVIGHSSLVMGRWAAWSREQGAGWRIRRTLWSMPHALPFIPFAPCSLPPDSRPLLPALCPLRPALGRRSLFSVIRHTQFYDFHL